MRSACKRDPQRVTAAGYRFDAEDERRRQVARLAAARAPFDLSRPVIGAR